ncbi:MAG: DUF1848 domain-containing protein [Rhodospirillales bacterium]
MIVSASYRTDIPAHYGAWFLNRLKAGFCRVANPYGGKPATVSLRAGDVDGFVFWTRNPGPFAPALRELRALGLPFVVQFTVTGYPRALEAGVQKAARAVAQFKSLARRYGPRGAVWRYDPILFTSLTPADWHLENFAGLARALRGATDEAVVSLADDYRKTRRNLAIAARAHGFAPVPPPGDLARFFGALGAIAAGHGMRLTACTEPALGVEPARCIDASRLSEIAGREIKARVSGNRPGCLCHESRDIGAYDSCAQGCVYCYAVEDRARAKRALAAHDPGAEFLARAGA